MKDQHACKECNYKTTRKTLLMRNIENKHVKTRSNTPKSTSFKCEMCAYYTRRRSDYKCTYCEGTCSQNPSLKKHIESDRISSQISLIDSCDHCNYSANWPATLTYHKDRKHEGFEYSCDQCEYKAYRLDQLA